MLVRAKDGIEFIMYREVVKGILDIIAPAPTLAEILEADKSFLIARSHLTEAWTAWKSGLILAPVFHTDVNPRPPR